ncbi:SDR family NAD(P)-dependent oxidoreductase [uncultured Modestobacter sp.]|uniref:SDR family NAD(P)-dependent oxidoreductase n=1 Tax=uncultured Modestobacter sp. TaxID=380048 RepID=UPI0026077BC2|nr:SDR family NAD(P)-dependent oxidoreductase [uncultured Modestobacter sp.]
MADNEHWEGRVVLVTGAASGIGLGLARGAARAGAVVHLADRDADGVRDAAYELTADGARATAHVCDVTNGDAVRRLVDHVAAASGRLDTAFLNAGVNGVPSMMQPGGSLLDLPFEAWRRVLDVNLDGLFHGLQACARVMVAQGGGSILVTASTAGLRAEPRVSYPYVASKSAVVGLVRQAALELAGYGVRVNAVAPGPVTTNIAGPGPRDPANAAGWQASIPMGRWGSVDDVVPTALLLASPESLWTTGSVHVVDGGASVLTQLTADGLPGNP